MTPSCLRDRRGQHEPVAAGISPETGLLSGVPEQLTFLATEAGFGFQAPSAALLGDVLRVAFWNVTANVDLWSLPLDANEGRPVGQMRQLTHNAAIEQWGSLSADGKAMTYNVRTRVNWDVWLMDLESGRRSLWLSARWPKIGTKSLAMAAEWLTRWRTVRNRRSTSLRWVLRCREGVRQLHRTMGLVVGRTTPAVSHRLAIENWRDRFNGWREHRAPPSAGQSERPAFFPRRPLDRIFGRGISYIRWRGRAVHRSFRGTAEIPFAEWQVVSDSSDSLNAAAGWSPDGNLLYFMSERMDPAAYGRSDWTRRSARRASRSRCSPSTLHKSGPWDCGSPVPPAHRWARAASYSARSRRAGISGWPR